MIDISKIDFEKSNGLVPAIAQDWISGQVLMVGYMNEEAVTRTLETKIMTFFSRSKGRLWVKGEESGNFLSIKKIFADCDSDTILCLVEAAGPTCHTGSTSCFGENNQSLLNVLMDLEKVIVSRDYVETQPSSYTASLLREGVGRIAQKVGEEGVEVALAAVHDFSAEKLAEEGADLLYHLCVLLYARNMSLVDVLQVLRKRREQKS